MTAFKAIISVFGGSVEVEVSAKTLRDAEHEISAFAEKYKGETVLIYDTSPIYTELVNGFKEKSQK